jgi:hypothetical protein
MLLLVLGSALSAAPAASADVITDDGGDVPFYARITSIGSPPQIFHDGALAVVVFYRPPGCVPVDFDILTFFHFPSPMGPGAFGCNPPTTKGFNVWRNGPGLDPAPTLAVTTGVGAVPVWFVAWPNLETALADGKLPMGELASLPRLEGTASSFGQVLRPHGTNDVPMTSFVASGTLTDGRSFSAAGLFVEGVTIQTRIAFSS